MDATGSVLISHATTTGLIAANIRSVEAWIRYDDSDALASTVLDLNYLGADGWITWDTNDINLIRAAAGIFNSVSFDTVGYDGNRGWVKATSVLW